MRLKTRWQSPLTLCLRCVCVALLCAVAIDEAQAQTTPRSKQEQAKAWSEIAKLPDFWQGSWQSVSPIADDFRKPVPKYTPWARDYIAKYQPKQDSPFANCSPLGVPFLMFIGGMPMKFFQSPGMIALYVESSGMTRFIRTDGRAHDPRANPSFLGESIGHWEGDTLVVDTTALADGTLFQIGKKSDKEMGDGDPSPLAGVVFGPHSPKLRVVERMKLIDFNTLEIQTTLYDDTIFVGPHTLNPRRFVRGIERRNEPQEWACTDNRDSLDINGQLQYDLQDDKKPSSPTP